MDTLDGTSWDVLIAGTGIQQSLLALALSRSGKKILQVDKNDHYGESEAALSLQEAESWADKVNKATSGSPFSNVKIQSIDAESAGDETGGKLAFSRAYSLCLAPNLIYTRSGLLPMLVSTRLHEQIDFQAIGSWFVFAETPRTVVQESNKDAENVTAGKLTRVPNSRENIFSDTSLNLRAKGSLVKFLRFVTVYEEKEDEWVDHKDEPFSDFLTRQFKLPSNLHGPLLALTMSSSLPSATTTAFALRRIANHLRSIGLFGPGFSAVLPKWGGLSEIVQVACRAGAVGGSVYVLNKAIEDIKARSVQEEHSQDASSTDEVFSVRLADSETVTTRTIVSSDQQLPKDAYRNHPTLSSTVHESASPHLSRSISIVSSGLVSLFPAVGEGSPSPAGAIAVFPSSFSDKAEISELNDTIASPPVYTIIHSSDTGECPSGQCIVYASTAQPIASARSLLEKAVVQLLAGVDEPVTPRVLWSMSYEQEAPPPTVIDHEDAATSGLIRLNGPSLDLVFDEEVLSNVEAVWRKIMGQDAEGFMQFQDNDRDDNTNE